MVLWFGIGASAPVLAQCMDWDASFARPGFDAEVYVTLEFQGELYAGGLFNWADGVPAHQVARWDGSSWKPVGPGVGSWNDHSNPALGDQVRAMVVHDAGSGPELYVGGKFASPEGLASNVARWDGSAWQAVGAGLLDVYALAVFDGGAGPELIAAGGGGTAGHVMRWDGSTWVAFDEQPDKTVHALFVHDDGSGPQLYAGGEFTSVGGLPDTAAVARWDGAIWQAVSPGTALSGTARAFVEFDAGSGSALYALGSFAVSPPTRHVALEWSGGQWLPLGAFSQFHDGGFAGTVFDDESGPSLYVGGEFTSIDGVPASALARWDGLAWTNVPGGPEQQGVVSALAAYDAGAGEDLYVGGSVTLIGNPTDLDVGNIARFDGSSWSVAGNSLPGPNNKVNDLALFDEGFGPVVFAGGNFRRAGQQDIDRIARWDGDAWSPLGSGTDGQVWALEVHDDGSGSALYAGGNFDLAGGVAVGNVARWDGGGWSPVGALDGTVDCLVVFDAGAGNRLYAGGNFTGGVARWDGTSWSTVGLGVLSAAKDFAIHDAGSGAALYATGSLPGMPNAVARLDGSSWTALGSGMDLGVEALASYHAGAGAELYAGGLFNFAGGVLAPNIARWNGGQWQPVGNAISSSINELTVYDDGAGPELIAFGLPTGSLPGAAAWDGTGWSGFHGGLDASARASLVVGTEIHVAGGFEAVDLPRRVPSQRIARFGPATTCPPVAYCTAGTSASGCQAQLSSSGTPSATAASGFSLQATTVEGQKDGLFFFGTSGQQANAWGNGTSYQCVVPPVKRAGLLAGSGTGGACDGSFLQDLNALWCPTCPKPGHGPGAGVTVQAQLWYRDPSSTSNQTTSLSDAIEFVVAP